MGEEKLFGANPDVVIDRLGQIAATLRVELQLADVAAKQAVAELTTLLPEGTPFNDPRVQRLRKLVEEEQVLRVWLTDTPLARLILGSASGWMTGNDKRS